MRFSFRPMLAPTLWFIPAFAILISLGVWQIERLHWKLDLLARIKIGLSGKPVSIGDAYGDAVDYGARDDHITQADYRRVFVRGWFQNNQEIRFFTTGDEGAPVYHIVTPFFVPGLWDFWRCSVCPQFKPDGAAVITLNRQIYHGRDGIILVDRGYVPVGPNGAQLAKPAELEGERTIVGILRKPSAPNWFTPPADKTRRIVHTRDPQTLAAAFGWKRVFPMFLEADAAPNPGGWPKGGQTIVDLPNNHMQYIITWFGLALGLLAVYLAYHRSRGRLRFFLSRETAKSGRK